MQHERVRQCFGKENTSSKFSGLIAWPTAAAVAMPPQGDVPGTV